MGLVKKISKHFLRSKSTVMETAEKEDVKKSFNRIYQREEWQDENQGSLSGPGSDDNATQTYVEFVNKELYKLSENISNSVRMLDIGCGDFKTASHFDHSLISEYIGWDAAQTVVERNQRKYGNNKTHFVNSLLGYDSLPEVDLITIKDVLQHLPNELILRVLSQDFPRNLPIIATDDLKKEVLGADGTYRPVPAQELNKDIAAGQSRPLDLTSPPFSLSAEKSMLYEVYLPGGLRYTKQLIAFTL